MDESDKPFKTVDIVPLVMIAVLSDVADLATDLIVAVPVVGQVAYIGNTFLISPIVWGTIQGWFLWKVGFGAPGLINVAGGIGNVIGLPGSETASVLIAIYLANHRWAAALATKAMPGGVVGKVTAKVGTAGAEVGAPAAGAGKTAAATKERAPATGIETAGEAAEVGARGAEGAAAGERAGEITEATFGAEAPGEVKELEAVKKPMEEPPEPELKPEGGDETPGKVLKFTKRTPEPEQGRGEGEGQGGLVDLRGNDVDLRKQGQERKVA
jgi:hypothetical protein